MSVYMSIIQDGRRAKKGNKYPIKLRVFSNGKAKYYPTVFDLTKEDYQKLTAKRIAAELDKIRNQLNTVEIQAKIAIQELDPFTHREFERDFVSQNKILKVSLRRSACCEDDGR